MLGQATPATGTTPGFGEANGRGVSIRDSVLTGACRDQLRLTQ